MASQNEHSFIATSSARRYTDQLESSLPEWQKGAAFEALQARSVYSAVKMIDIFVDGHTRVTNLQTPKFDPEALAEAYLFWAQEQRRVIDSYPPGLKTRLVLSQFPHCDILMDLFALPLGVEFSFFSTSLSKLARGGNPTPFPTLLPAFLDLEEGCCVKVLQGRASEPGSRGYPTIALMVLPERYDTSPVHFQTLARFPGLDPSDQKYGPRIAEDTYRRNTVEVYAEILRQWHVDQYLQANSDPLNFLYPLIDLRIEYSRAKIADIGGRYRYQLKHSTNPYREFWKPLRQNIDVARLMFRAFRQFCMLHSKSTASGTQDVQALSTKLDIILEEARELEEYLRHDLQLQVGQLSLEESRMSIQQSNIVIEEGKQMKLITILAFIFIPVSLATSIFGMNVQELNHTGQSIWVFVVTAVSIMVTAFIALGISYQWARFIHAPRSENLERQPWNERFKALLWLSFHGHFIWTFKSGIWFALLTDGRHGFRLSCKGRDLTGRTSCQATEGMELGGAGEGVWKSTHDASAPWSYVEAHRRAGADGAFSSQALDQYKPKRVLSNALELVEDLKS